MEDALGILFLQSMTLVNKPRYRCTNLLILEFKFGESFKATIV